MAGRKPELKLVKSGKKFTLIRGGKRTTKADVRKARIILAKSFLCRLERELRVLKLLRLSRGKRGRRGDAFDWLMKRYGEWMGKIHKGTISDFELEAIMKGKKKLEELEGT